jgi:hypothetical protein
MGQRTPKYLRAVRFDASGIIRRTLASVPPIGVAAHGKQQEMLTALTITDYIGVFAMNHRVYTVIQGRAVWCGQQRKRRDARHMARMSRLPPIGMDDITLESAAKRSSLEPYISEYTDATHAYVSQ